jgi:peptide/nickel transport system permease protein
MAPRRRALRPIAGLRAVVRRPSGAFGVLIVGSLLFLTAFGWLVAPYGSSTQDIPNALQGPTLHHLLGTDYLGRDILSRLIIGTHIELGVAVPAVAIAASSGLILGTVAGYFGGLVDNVLVVVMDALQAFPAVILALALLFLLGSSTSNVMLVIGVAFTPGYARVSRALVHTTKQNPFIEAERALGASHRRIVLVHLVPNIIAPLFILMAMDIPSAIVVEAGLSFLGLGVQPPTPSWGVILSDGFQYVYQSPWAIIWASAALMVTTLGFTMLGETLRDVFDPRVSGIRRWRRA